MSVSIIAATTPGSHVIGRNNQLPWRQSADLSYFKNLTLNKTIVMGRKTFESIGRPLPKRNNVVVSTQSSYRAEGCETFSTLMKALAHYQHEELFIIGGATIYDQSMSLADKLYITFVHAPVQGDAFFPAIPGSQWDMISIENHPADEKNQYAYSFAVFNRR